MKKWTFLVAALLATASAGSVLTGCIDNDEPFGIQEIRKATANLLESKKALLDAQAAAANAQVEVEKIKAEVAKAELEVKKITAEAEAKVQEAIAEAKKLQAAADAAKTQAEADKLKAEAAIKQAEADAIKAAAEAKLERYKAETQDKIANAEIALKTSELEYEKLAYSFEQLKLKNAAIQQDRLYKALERAFGTYVRQLGNYNTANKEYIKANQDYLAATVDLDKEGDEWKSPLYEDNASLEAAVAYWKGQIELSNEAIAKYDGVVAEMKAIKPSELETLLNKYSAEFDALNIDFEKKMVERAEIEVKNEALFNTRKQLAQELDGANGEEIAIPAVTFEPIANVNINNLTEPFEVIGEGHTWSLDNMTNFNQDKGMLAYMVNGLTRATLSDNEQAWTQANINELKRQLEEENALYSEDLNRWKVAVAVYNEGNVPNLDALTEGVDEVNKAIAGYNAYSTSLTAAKNAVISAEADAETAKAKWLEEDAKFTQETSIAAQQKKIEETYAAATVAATEAYNTIDKNASTVLLNQIATNDKAKEEAAENIKYAQDKLEAAKKLLTSDINNKDYKKLVEDAEKAVEDATAAATKVGKDCNEALSKATATYLATRNKAFYDYNMAKAKALDEYEKALIALKYSTEADAALVAAKEAYDNAVIAVGEANDAYSDLQEDAQKALEAIKTALKDQGAQIGLGDYINLVAFKELSKNYTAWVNDLSDEAGAFPTTKYADVQGLNYMNPITKVYDNAKKYVEDMSLDAFGFMYTQDRINESRLVALDKTLMDKMISEFDPDLNSFELYQWYQWGFGSYGVTEYLKNRIAVGEAYLSNANLIAQLTKQFNDAIDDLDAKYDEQIEKVKAITDKQTANEKAIDALFTEIDADLAEIHYQMDVLDHIIAVIERSISFTGNEGQPQIKDVEWAIEHYTALINSEKKRIADYLEPGLEKAEYQLGLYAEYKLTRVDVLKQKAEAKKAELDRQQEILNFFKARVDELQKAYDAATGETAE